jgi:MoxR-like ATPase
MLVKNKIIYIDDKNYRRRSENILRNVGNLRLTGETGTGKSTLVYHLCHENGWELHEYQLSTDTSRWDLLAQDILVPEVTAKGVATKSALRLGVVCRWLLGPYEKPEAKQVLFLDEFNYAQPQVLTLLNSLCDFRDRIHVPELVGNTDLHEPNLDSEGNIKRTKGKHLLIIAMNPAEKAQYVGTIGMNIAQLRRFESVEIDYMPYTSERQAIITALPEINNQKDLIEVKNLLAIAAQTRSKYRNGEIGNPITTANIINYLRMYKDKEKPMPPDDIRDTILSMYKESEQDAIKAIFAESDKDKGQE